MMAGNHLQQVPLAELGAFRNGVNFGKGLKGSGLGLINVKDIFTDSPHLDFESLDLVDLASAKGIDRYFVEEGDLFFVRSSVKRDGIGYVTYSDRRNHSAVHCGFVIRFRPIKQQVDYRFLTYALRSPESRERIRNLSGGAAITNISQEALSTLLVDLPPLPVQRRIAGILSAYDELIENIQRRIKILEAMARALYREWFVHFRFPGHESVPRVPSPLGDIPQGWEVNIFGEIYNTSSGGTPSRKRPDYFEGGNIDWVKSQELLDGFILNTEERITPEALENSSAKVFPANTVLIALYGATIGMLGILAEESATNQACCAVISKSAAYGREFAFLTLLTNRERLIGLRFGAAQQNISQVLLRNFECVKPPPSIAIQFTERASPLFDGKLTLQRQIQNLRRTRDLLLSRLLSGQIDVEGD